MCNDHLLGAAVILVAGAALAALLARLDAWREMRRKERRLVDALARLEQSRHFWRPSPHADTERRA
jgi:biopolymer transport protein ExbB/TolQ